MMLGSKLIVLAALLSAVALGAPRFQESFAVEETLVQSSARTASAVAMLKEQFKALEVQIKSGAEVTPAVARVIKEMIKMVDEQIVPAIKLASSSDQDDINAKMKIITDFNSAQTTKRDLLLQEGKEIESDIQDHNQVALEWDQAAKAFLAAIAHYEKTTKAKTDTCCDKQQAAVPATEYTPAFAKCDYKEKDASGCSDRAQEAAAQAVQDAFESGLKRYNALVGGCKSLTAKQVTAKSDMDKKDAHCDRKSFDCKEKKKNLDKRMGQFETNWGNAVSSYDSGIKEAEANFTVVQTRVKADEADRKEEWRSTQEIRCMLNNYVAGGTFDDAAMNLCSTKIGTAHLDITYPPIPARVEWPKPTFTELTDWTPYAKDCENTENADEAADAPGACTIVPTPAAPVCDPSTPAPGEDGTGGPRWSLSEAAKVFAS